MHRHLASYRAYHHFVIVGKTLLRGFVFRFCVYRTGRSHTHSHTAFLLTLSPVLPPSPSSHLPFARTAVLAASSRLLFQQDDSLWNSGPRRLISILQRDCPNSKTNFAFESPKCAKSALRNIFTNLILTSQGTLAEVVSHVSLCSNIFASTLFHPRREKKVRGKEKKSGKKEGRER